MSLFKLVNSLIITQPHKDTDDLVAHYMKALLK